MVDNEHRLTKVEELAAGNKRRITKLEEERQDMIELIKSVSAIAQKQEDMESDMKEIKADVKTLAGKPAQRWESVVEKALLTIVAALVGWCLLKIGIG